MENTTQQSIFTKAEEQKMDNRQAFRALLKKIRDNSLSEREKGTSFEKLTQFFLKTDSTYSPRFSKVQMFTDWAKEHGKSGADTGIDLVATISTDYGIGYCAIQCKMYADGHSIKKGDVDTFFTASGKTDFSERMIVETSRVAWSKHAEDALEDQHIPLTRLTVTQFEESNIDWIKYLDNEQIALLAKKDLHPHQKQALDEVQKGFTTADRGKLIMACGTGKTFTSLKIAEKLFGRGKTVLYLVPSLALMSQSVKEWNIDKEMPLRCLSVCSDVQVGKKTNKDDIAEINSSDLAYPAHTDAQKLAKQMAMATPDKMTVLFATYQSIQVVSDAQNIYGMGQFDLIICDEAHRTTGATFAGDKESNFVKVHDQKYIQSAKRLYMTATPRVYGDNAKDKADRTDATLASMDDVELYGDTFHSVNFGYAVENNLLTDYKVIVLAVSEDMVDKSFQAQLRDGFELDIEDTAKLVGCYKALSKLDIKGKNPDDVNPMQRAVAFCKSIKASESIQRSFPAIVENYKTEDERAKIDIAIEHVDGTFNAKTRNERLSWLKDEPEQNECRILTNARCLAEGVDVPSLDAIMFLHPRNSQVDIVQGIGRVMRRAEGKEMGYVVIPVAIPTGMEADVALDKNDRFAGIWQILNALRSHDERLDANINRGQIGGNLDQILKDIIEVVPMVDSIAPKTTALNANKTMGDTANDHGGDMGDDYDPANDDLANALNDKVAEQMGLDFGEKFNKAMMAQIVKKCGNRLYWDDWAKDVAEIAQTLIKRIENQIADKSGTQHKAFMEFVEELQDDLNPSISEDDAVEMVAQHIITKPIFETLFGGDDFTRKNAVSQAMERVIAQIENTSMTAEINSLDKFYDSVKRRASGLKTITEKQNLILTLYDKFFKTAFPRVTEALGIVYTPVEVVDFIIHSINHILQKDFGQTLGAKGVSIIDPFTGTGTFITRLLQSGLITPEQLEHKYKNEIHANEIVLLAYYIASVNIEQVYHQLRTENGDTVDYTPFEGICLTDTFQMYESEDLVSRLMVDNSERRKKQKALDIKVIMGNPPYSAKQGSANDNNANISYSNLDQSIENTYVKHTDTTNHKDLYDSYIRAIRWGSDRLGDCGVLGFVSGSGYIKKASMTGIRKCLAEEYSDLYIFNLRGDIRTNMLSKGKAGEGENIFGQGSMTGIAIAILVKNPNATTHGNIHYHDIGDNLKKAEKMQVITTAQSIKNIRWETITPDKYNDWIHQRDDSFYDHMPMGDKKDKTARPIFANYSLGLATGRDSWCYNSSKSKLADTMQNMIAFYNAETERYQNSDKKNAVKDFVDKDIKKISWTDNLYKDCEKNKAHTFNENNIINIIYRPFSKQNLYYTRTMNTRVYQMPQIFPESNMANIVIMVSGTSPRSGISSVFISNLITDLQSMDNGQCFPLKLYEKNDGADLLSVGDGDYMMRDGITDHALKHFAYDGETITKEDVFYYIYGILNNPDYRQRFEQNLTKALPHIPKVKTATDFWIFSKAGRNLAHLHLNYETVEKYDVSFNVDIDTLTNADFYVEKMKYGKDSDKNKDITTVVYNNKITVSGIPLQAYEYEVNGKPAIDWVIDRQGVRTDKKSGITNDANDYAIETMNNPRYPLELLQRVITVSIETQKIIKSLPTLDI